MEDIKLNIAQNIASLRKDHNLTQFELAEKLNYSDKAISKWERAESIPDITVLKAIADVFGVTVDYLIRSEHDDSEIPNGEGRNAIIEYIKRRRIIVTIMSTLLVWVIATLLFVILDLSLDCTWGQFLPFAYAMPVGSLVWLIFNSIWHNKRVNYIIISIMMWTLLSSIHLTVLISGYDIWQLYLLGIPGQIIIALWSFIGRKINKK